MLWMVELVMFLWWNMLEKLSIHQRQQLLPIQLKSSDHMTAAAAVLVTAAKQCNEISKLYL